MKKTIKLLLSALLSMVMFSCIIIEEYREVEIYNGTRAIFTDVYVIPESEFPYPTDFRNNYDVANQCDTFYQHYEQTGYGSLYNRSTLYVDLDSIDMFEDYFVVVAIDTDGYAYYDNFTDFDTSISLYDSSYMGNFYY